MIYLADSGIVSLIMAIVIGALGACSSYAGDKKKRAKRRESFLSGERQPDVRTDSQVWEGLLGKEGEPATIVQSPAGEREADAVESGKAAVTTQEREGEEKLSEFKKRIKNSPRDLILFTEIMRPKYKEL